MMGPLSTLLLFGLLGTTSLASETALHEAARGNNVAGISSALQRGLDIDEVSKSMLLRRVRQPVVVVVV